MSFSPIVTINTPSDAALITGSCTVSWPAQYNDDDPNNGYTSESVGIWNAIESAAAKAGLSVVDVGVEETGCGEWAVLS